MLMLMLMLVPWRTAAVIGAVTMAVLVAAPL